MEVGGARRGANPPAPIFFLPKNNFLVTEFKRDKLEIVSEQLNGWCKGTKSKKLHFMGPKTQAWSIVHPHPPNHPPHCS